MTASRFSVSSLLSFFSRSPRLFLRSSKVGPSDVRDASVVRPFPLSESDFSPEGGVGFRRSWANAALPRTARARIARALLVLLMGRLLVVAESLTVELVDGVL